LCGGASNGGTSACHCTAHKAERASGVPQRPGSGRVREAYPVKNWFSNRTGPLIKLSNWILTVETGALHVWHATRGYSTKLSLPHPYNIAPTQRTPVVVAETNGRTDAVANKTGGRPVQGSTGSGACSGPAAGRDHRPRRRTTCRTRPWPVAVVCAGQRGVTVGSWRGRRRVGGGGPPAASARVIATGVAALALV